jgi:hypothetical protein
MTYLLALLAGIAGAVIGFLVAAFIGMGIAAAVRISNFEGAAGYFVVFVAGPIGLLIGLFLGMYLVLRFHGGFTGFGAIAGRSALLLVAIGALVASGVFIKYLSIDMLNPRGAKPQLLFHIRFPPGAPTANVRVELQTDRNSADALVSIENVAASERPQIHGSVALAYRAGQRLIVLRLPDQPDRVFRLNTPATPIHSDAFGDWERVNLVASPGAGPMVKPGPNDDYDIRYRVRNPQVEFSRPVIAFELSLPATTPLPDAHDKVSVAAHFADNGERGILRKDIWQRRDGNRVILSGTAQLAGERSSTIAVALPAGATWLFEVNLPPAPSPVWPWPLSLLAPESASPPSEEFGPWQPVDAIIDRPGAPQRPARPEDGAQVRYYARLLR